MDFIKKHYEKVVLGAVLVGLAVGTAFLPIMIASEREGLDQKSQQIIRRPVEPIPEPDLSDQNALFKRLDTPMHLDFSRDHRLFNPVPWVKSTDGKPIKAEEGNVGPKAVTITKITPLYTTVSFESTTVSDSGARYVIGVQRDAALIPSQRNRKMYYSSLNTKNDAFMIREVKGPPEDPSELVLEMNDTGEMVSIAKDHPFKREDGYTADFKYDPEKKTWTNRRVGSLISFGGEDYIIVAITKDEMVLSARSNNKKTPISYNTAADTR
jgi:hypothetical protein